MSVLRKRARLSCASEFCLTARHGRGVHVLIGSALAAAGISIGNLSSCAVYGAPAPPMVGGNGGQGGGQPSLIVPLAGGEGGEGGDAEGASDGQGGAR